MKKALTLLLSAAFLATLVGCVQEATLVEVNPDGSGKLILRMLLSEQSNTVSLFGQKPKDSSAAEKQIAEIRAKLDGLADKLGEGVTLSKEEPIKRKGWVGIQATYLFKDINKVVLVSDQHLREPADGKEKKPDRDVAARMRIDFDFKPGRVSELKIRMTEIQKEDPADASDPFAQAGLKLKPAGGGVSGAMASGLMKAALQDARVTTLVKVNGKVTQTNAVHRPRPGSVMVMDFEFSRFANSDVFERAVMERWDVSELYRQNVPGLTGQKPGETVTVRFQAE